MTNPDAGEGESDWIGSPHIAVIIPALNASDTIARQIVAVLADRDERTELILVDNGSTDSTFDVMRELTENEPRVAIVREPRRGVNFARNAGISATKAPIVLLCDADDQIEPGWISALAKGLETCDLVGGSLRRISPTGEVVSEAELPDAHDRFGWGIPFAWGGCAGIRRDVYEQLGGFDERMSGGGDEADFFIRAQIAGASFTWCPDAIVRYSLRADADRHSIKRRNEGWRNQSRSYWYGRLRGWPRDGHLIADLGKSFLLLPLAPFSSHRRSIIDWRLMRVWGRFRGALTHLPEEWRRRPKHFRPPSAFGATRRFHRDWRSAERVEGWLSKREAAALYAAASRVGEPDAIVEVGSWKGRSTAALALGCRRQRPVHAVDPHTGGRSYVEANLPVDSLEHFQRTVERLRLRNVVPVIERSHDAALAYGGPPVSLLFIDGWHSIEAVLDDYRSWTPHLTRDATVIFDDRNLPEVLPAILELRPLLPPRMLEIGKLAIFTTW